jgi:hypothetical protein
MPRSRRLLHHHISALLQTLDNVVRDDLRHEIIAVPESAAAIALECEAESKSKFVGIGGRQVGTVVGHGGRLDERCEQSKNSRAPDAARRSRTTRHLLA